MVKNERIILIDKIRVTELISDVIILTRSSQIAISALAQ